MIPLFPLPRVVLFPGVFLPLHIFEPRYRAMVAEALDGDRLIGMALLRSGWEDEYDGRPPVYTTGCSGLITHHERLADGRYNLVLKGVERFRIIAEDQSGVFRRATVVGIPEEGLTPADRQALRARRVQLETRLAPHAPEGGLTSRMTAAMDDHEVVNALSQYLDLEPIEKQALLERPSVLSRADALIELLEMKHLASRSGTSTSRAH